MVAAHSQTSGRGQQHTEWESEAGKNLTFSLALRPTFLYATQMFYLSKAVSLGVVDFLLSQKICAAIKWPNDIYVNNQKICGILIEQSIKGEYIAHSVVGIGLNVNQRVFEHAPNATSMLLCDETERDLEAALRAVAAAILHRYDFLREGILRGKGVLRNGSPTCLQQVDSEYFSLLYRREGFHPYMCENAHFLAKILDVEASGELVLQKESGEVRRFCFKEVEFC